MWRFDAGRAWVGARETHNNTTQKFSHRAGGRTARRVATRHPKRPQFVSRAPPIHTITLGVTIIDDGIGVALVWHWCGIRIYHRLLHRMMLLLPVVSFHSHHPPPFMPVPLIPAEPLP